MSDRVNKLFSPERLRGRWTGAEERVAPSKEECVVPSATRQEVTSRLSILEKELASYRGTSVGPAIESHFLQLQQLVDERFPPPGKVETDTEEEEEARDIAVIDAELESTLNALENLLEAARYSRYQP